MRYIDLPIKWNMAATQTKVSAPQGNKIWWKRFLPLFFIVITGCARIEVLPTAIHTLPAPVVQITHEIQPLDIDTPTTAPDLSTQTAFPQSDIAKLADDLYGARMLERISIPALAVKSDIVPVGWRINFSDDLLNGEFEWDSPEENVGWVITSTLPDETGNIILYGHNNLYRKVFENLSDLKEGDEIQLQTRKQNWEYEVRYMILLPIIGANEQQLKNYQQYLKPTQDARVTIISCWPPASNTHRIIVIAMPADAP